MRPRRYFGNPAAGCEGLHHLPEGGGGRGRPQPPLFFLGTAALDEMFGITTHKQQIVMSESVETHLEREGIVVRDLAGVF